MTKMEMLTHYENFSKADKYIIGFTYKKQLYMLMVDHLDPMTITYDRASRNQGNSLRFRPKMAEKLSLLSVATCLGSADMVVADKYNKGEIFEKVVTEYYHQEWVKDSRPFHECGDLTVDGVEIQIKFENASLCTTNTLTRLLAVA